MRSFIVGVGLLLLVGCGKKQTIIYDQPSFPTGGRYEIAWVDPELVFSDTLFTLIRSDRIDSLYVKKPDMYARVVPSIRFDINEDKCNVAVNLLDTHLRVVIPLFVRRLPAGYYKLTFNPDRLSVGAGRSASHYLQVDFCDRSVRKAFVVR